MLKIKENENAHLVYDQVDSDTPKSGILEAIEARFRAVKIVIIYDFRLLTALANKDVCIEFRKKLMADLIEEISKETDQDIILVSCALEDVKSDRETLEAVGFVEFKDVIGAAGNPLPMILPSKELFKHLKTELDALNEAEKTPMTLKAIKRLEELMAIIKERFASTPIVYEKDTSETSPDDCVCLGCQGVGCKACKPCVGCDRIDTCENAPVNS